MAREGGWEKGCGPDLLIRDDCAGQDFPPYPSMSAMANAQAACWANLAETPGRWHGPARIFHEISGLTLWKKAALPPHPGSRVPPQRHLTPALRAPPLPRERGKFIVVTLIYHKNAPLPRERGRPGHRFCGRGGVRYRAEIPIPAFKFKNILLSSGDRHVVLIWNSPPPPSGQFKNSGSGEEPRAGSGVARWKATRARTGSGPG